MTYSASSKCVGALLLAGVLATYTAGCGDDDQDMQDGGDTLPDSSLSDAGVQDDAGPDDDAGDEDDAALVAACNESEQEIAELPIEVPKIGTFSFYQYIGLGAAVCEEEKEPVEACVLEIISDGSDGVIGESCGTCLFEGALCLVTSCTSCDEDPESLACAACMCGLSQEASDCIDAFETCAGYVPTICFE